MTRGSKLYFITCFSYVSCYFLTLVFVKLLLTNYFVPFLAARESNFLSHFLYFWHSDLVHRLCAPIFQAQNAWLSQSKMLSAFCRRFLVQTSVGRTRMIPFLLKNPQTDTFLHDISPAQLCNIAWEWNPQGIS
jgi:hypothetical protein